MMRFCCPDCGRDEEILLDRNPLCRACRVEMIAASDYSQLWMSPYIAITRMKTVGETYGTTRARLDGRFKKEREAWATGVLAIALSKLKEEEYWIEIETIESTPDNKLHYIDQSSGHNVIQTRSIEIVDWEQNVTDIMEVIEKKCSRGYPDHYLLLVNARRIGAMLNFDRITEKMKKIHTTFLETWVIAFVGTDDLKVVRVAPGGLGVDLKFVAELENAKKQAAFVKRGKRGTTPGFRELGATYLPIPRGD